MYLLWRTKANKLVCNALQVLYLYLKEISIIALLSACSLLLELDLTPKLLIN